MNPTPTFAPVFTELPKAVTADDIEALLPWNVVLNGDASRAEAKRR